MSLKSFQWMLFHGCFVFMVLGCSGDSGSSGGGGDISDVAANTTPSTTLETLPPSTVSKTTLIPTTTLPNAPSPTTTLPNAPSPTTTITNTTALTTTVPGSTTGPTTTMVSSGAINRTDTNEGASCTTSIAAEAPQWIKTNFKCVTVTVSGSNLVVKATSQPLHKSAYYGSSSALYEAMPSGKRINPNTIKAQNYSLTIPISAKSNGSVTATSYDAIGVSINGVVFFNNQAAPGDSLAQEIQTFDSGNGHPTQDGSYHYHIEPTKLTNNDAKLIGVLRDGFPVYGKKDEDGTTPSNLDSAHGHTHATVDFPDGIYHYHVTDSDPYIAGGYRGTPGTMTR